MTARNNEDCVPLLDTPSSAGSGRRARALLGVPSSGTPVRTDRQTTAFVFVVALLWTCFSLQAAEPPTGDEKKPAAPALDQRLPDDLERELMQGLDDAPRPAADRKPTEPPKRAASDLDRQLLKQLGDGEDLGEKSPDPLITLSRRMRTVEERIQQRDTAETTQRMQQEIVAELATLIEQCQKQCAGGQCDSASNAPSKPGGKPGSGKKGGTGNATASNQPAKDSTDTLRKPGGDRAELEAMQHLIKEVWGHLPPKLREQLQSGSVEQFLPRYEQLIEAYYKRLAEDRRESR